MVFLEDGSPEPSRRLRRAVLQGGLFLKLADVGRDKFALTEDTAGGIVRPRSFSGEK